MKKKLLSLGLTTAMVFSLAACGGNGGGGGGSASAEVPTIDQIQVGEDYQDLEAEIKVLTNRTDIVDTVYKGYAEEFMKVYPNIKVEYEGITDYEETLKLRLTTGDWGDLCFIPSSVSKSELSTYFTKLGDFDTLDPVYQYIQEKTFEGEVYGIANGGTARGIIYNKKVWADAGITELPTTPDEFLDDLKIIQEKTDAIPLYTNFGAGWTMGAWDDYIDLTATGDPDFRNNMPHTKDPFAKRDDLTGPYAVYYILYESVARGLIEDSPSSTDWESSKRRLNEGEIATMVLGSWAVEQCKEQGSTPEDVGYMPFPITVDGTQYTGSGGNYGFGINNQADGDNQIAAMVYLKWLLEESTIYTDEGSIPALKNQPLPDALADFSDTEIISNNAAPEGEDDLFDEVNDESEVGINKDDYPDAEILEYALKGEKTLDEIMGEWNEKWSAAQESLGVEVNQ